MSSDVNLPAQQLLEWYSRNARRLPWRGLKDAYAVWVSEIMLQQTRVETVIPYYRNWMKLFPTVQALANASEQEVLAAWEGLGYYSRARNLHLAARHTVEKFDGLLPREIAQLRSLPGIGNYTAAAIASMAFGVDVAALDSNIKRVYARFYQVMEPVDTPAGQKILHAHINRDLPAGHAGDFNQALMDLGSLVCLPRQPRCSQCPLAEMCQAYAAGNQDLLPVRRPKKAIPHHTVVSAVIERDGRYLLAKRPAEGLLGGLWEFPGGKVEPGETLPQALRRELQEELNARIRIRRELGVYRHAYTHFRITLHAYLCSLIGEGLEPLQAQAIAWLLPGDLGRFPMGKIDRLIARRLNGNAG